MTPTPEARERVERIVTGAFDLGHSITVEDLRGIIATELTAVRAALVAEMVAQAEAMKGWTLPIGHIAGWVGACDALQERIRATAHPTETDNGKL